MLKNDIIEKSLLRLNFYLQEQGVKGEILLCGGAVMCLVFNARNSTRDIDAIFEPTSEIRIAAKKVAAEMQLPEDWLNDSAKSFFSPLLNKVEIRSWSNLSVWAPTADYMLAMKCISARYDSQDKNDVEFLIKELKLKTAESVFKIIESFYPKKQVPAKTQFFIEELFDI